MIFSSYLTSHIPMFINYYQSYLAMIRASVWVPLWKNLFITKDEGATKDILHDGSVSCAYFVSCILKTFNLTGATFANVLSLKKHCIEYGWKEIPLSTNSRDIPLGSLIVRDYTAWSEKKDIYNNSKNGHYHIGFFMGDEQAISNMSDQFNQWDHSLSLNKPSSHHRTYYNTRSIVSLMSFTFNPTLMEYISSIYPAWLINHQLEIPFVGMTKVHLEQYGVKGGELIWALWQDDHTNILNHGRMCWPACIVSAYQYITWKKDKTIHDTLIFKDQTHSEWWWGFYFQQKPWRYHDGLIAIAKSRWINGSRGEIDNNDISWLRKLVANCIDNRTVLICSVSPWFDTQSKGWHLVIVRWYNRNGYQEELIVNDPLNENTIPVPVLLSSFAQSWSGKYIILEKAIEPI